jgi:hypothetical protein
MPDYAAVADVQSEMGALASGLTATSTPSLTDVTDRIIPDIHGDIDGVLSRRGLAVPVLAPSSFLDRLKALNALGAAARVAAQLFPTDPAAMAFAKWVQERYDAGLMKLENGDGIPDDVLVILNAGGGGMPRSFATSHPDSVSADLDATPGNTIDPVFRRDTLW